MTTYRIPGLRLTDHTFAVPLNHDDPDGPRIEVYGREVAAPDGGRDLPWLVFLQGGPGFPAPRPPAADGWLRRAVRDYRVLLLDQRGTGRSTPANRRTLRAVGDARAQAEYLTHFRADSIVRDAELIRRELLGDQRWSILGQSFGGFCALTYLSFWPEGLHEVMITGGLPGLGTAGSAESCYRATYPKVAARTAAHYERFPEDARTAQRIVHELRDNEVVTPNGVRLTVEGFQALGQLLGASTGSAQLHYLLEDAFDGGPGLTDVFLNQVGPRLSFIPGPLYAVLHEACVADGTMTKWAAQRVRAEFPEFDTTDGDGPPLFTGEMIYPWMLETDPVLRPLRETADILAAWDRWPRLYDEERLRANEVPVVAAVYHDDMYVPYELSMPTARTIRGLRTWVTSEYEHDGLRASDGAVLDRLLGMLRGAA
jgi:pimeloyl-ACP methyl ester carboxylesterase